ncbi:MAG TPA: lipase family protein [Candidatus Angelobacter sp.]|nr:lipase family protein [Candidatus Angelobacter sp.]
MGSPVNPTSPADYLNFVNYAYEMYDNDPNSLTPPTPDDFPSNYSINLYLTAVDPWAEQRVFYGFLAKSTDPKAPQILAVRGTDGLPEWLNNFNIVPASFPVPNTYVSGGFSNVFTTLQWEFPGKTLMDTKSALATTANSGVVMAGHSLGGAIVTMIALYFWYTSPPTTPFWIYTAASPAVGCSEFADEFNTLVPNSSRFINQWDIVAGALDLIYTQVNGDGVPLESDDVWPTPGCEHSLYTYLWLIEPSAYPLHSDCSWGDLAKREVFAKIAVRRRTARLTLKPA